MEINVLKINGEETGRKVTLEDAIFGIEPNDHAIYLDVKQYLAHRRQGTAKTKERSENAHSTRKLFRQKGTGGARRGDIKSPIVKGGGTIFGPKPRVYDLKVNKKVKKLARLSALSYKAKDSEILVIEDFSMEAPKTKEFVKILKGLKIEDIKTLFLMDNADANVLRSAHNIPGVSLERAEQVNTYRLLDARKLIFTESGLKKLVEVLNA